MRKSLIKVFQRFSDQHNLHGDERFKYKNLCELQKLIQLQARESRKKSKSYIQEIIDDIDLSLICLTGIAIPCVLNTSESPSPRILISGFPAKDINLGNCLINIINTAISINKLCQEGLDTQARVLVRTLDERLLQTPILFSNAEDYQKWHEAETDSDSKQVHYELFSKKQKLYKKYAILESICFNTSNDGNEATLWRKENEEYYSMAVHGSSAAVQIGSWAFDFDSDNVRPNIFDSPSSASVSTLQHIRFELFWFILLFQEILKKFHNWEPNPKNEWDRIFMACNKGVVDAAREWLPEHFNSNLNKVANLSQ